MKIMGPLQVAITLYKRGYAGEQMTRSWDMFKKENLNLVSLFSMSQHVICSPA